jgi:hypothetical protein
MTLKTHQERFLAMLGQRPRQLREFTHVCSMELQYLSAPIVEQYLMELVRDHYAELIGGLFYLAPLGSYYLAAQAEEKERYARANPGLYTGPRWNLRNGSQDFLKYQSRGLG